MIHPVILSGGSGTRLWPLSREQHPKQLIRLLEGRSLLQATVERAAALEGVAPPIIICNASHRFLVAEQIRELGLEPGRIILEPEGRNTAPAVAAAAVAAMADEEDPLLLVMPADHLIEDRDRLLEAFRAGAQLASQGHLVTFGVQPTAPETGYGYIQAGEPIGDAGGRVVSRFVEKPDRSTAETYLASGDYLWNAGMFMFTASSYLEALGQEHAEMVNCATQAVERAEQDLDFLRLDEASFSASPSDSIDYAVMETTDQGAVVPLDLAWNDVGSWPALAEILEVDEHGNTLYGDVVLADSGGNTVYARHRLVGLVGMRDHVVVETADAVMVAPKSAAQDVKKLVAELRERGRSEAELHREVHRPWGSFEGLDSGPGYQVKRLVVKPGQRLSLQLHHHRAEHWVVVRGTARVTLGDDVFDLTANQSTYIPVETRHRLENPGDQPLEVIEVQSGDYLGEDDIVRFSDDFGRDS